MQRQVVPEVNQDPSIYVQVDLLSQFGMIVVSTAIFSILVYAVMRAFNYRSRVYLTLFAFFGTSVVFNAILLILGSLTAFAVLIWLMLFVGIGIWTLVVSGQIFANAMEITLFRGILVYIGITIAGTVLQLLIFGMPPGFAMPDTVPTT